MSKSTRIRTAALLLGGVVVATAAVVAVRLVPKIQKWQHLDATYAETFVPPTQLAPGLAGQRVLFHMKTGLAQDDSQICVGFNIILAALEAGADVTVLFDAGALLDITGESSKLESTGVPERLRKVIAAQMHRPLDEMPGNYGEYLEYLHRRGTKVYANTAMLVVTGDAATVQRDLPSYPFIEPTPYAQVARLITEADTVLVY